MGLSAAKESTRTFYGYAAADKENSSQELYVYCPELLPFIQGKIKATAVENEIQTVSSKSPYKGQLKTSNCLKCTYKDNETNRAFPPSVRAGEKVEIYNVADTDTWYWKSAGRSDESRRTDTMRMACNDSLDNVSNSNDDSTYFMEVDTRDKQHVKISTSSSNGEKFRYTILIDAKSGAINIGDSNENSFSIDSAHPRVCMKNKDGSLIDLNAQNIVISCENDISIMAKSGKMSLFSKGQMVQQTESTLDVYAKDNMSVKTDAKFSRESASSTTLICNAEYDSKVTSTMSFKSGSNAKFDVGGSFDTNFGGSCNWNGGAMTMSIGHLSISG